MWKDVYYIAGYPQIGYCLNDRPYYFVMWSVGENCKQDLEDIVWSCGIDMFKPILEQLLISSVKNIDF